MTRTVQRFTAGKQFTFDDTDPWWYIHDSATDVWLTLMCRSRKTAQTKAKTLNAEPSQVAKYVPSTPALRARYVERGET